MAWTARYDGPEVSNGQVQGLRVTFNDGFNDAVFRYPPSYTEAQLKGAVAHQIVLLQAMSDAVGAIPVGPLDVSAELAAIAAADELTAEQNSARGQLQRLKQDLDLGLVEQADYDAKVTELKTAIATAASAVTVSSGIKLP